MGTSNILFNGAAISPDLDELAATEAAKNLPMLSTPDGRYSIELAAVEPSPYDEGLDLINLPAPPWTYEALGPALFKKLSRVTGVGDLSRQTNPSLDPRSFGMARAKLLIRVGRKRGDEAAALMAEGRRLQAIIDAKLPPRSGTPRKPGAPPLSAATTTQGRRNRRRF